MNDHVEIIVNGDMLCFDSAGTVAALLERLEITAGKVAVERNRAIVPSSAFSNTRLESGDVIEIVHFVGGG